MQKKLIPFAARILLSLLVLAGPSSGQSLPQQRSGDDTSKEWQTDFNKFIETLRECAKVNCPIATFKGAKVIWQGTFTSWDNKAGMARIDMGIADPTLNISGTTNKLLCCAPSVAESAQWKAIQPGSTVMFQAYLNGLVPILVAKGTALVLLEKATIVGPKSNGGQNSRPSQIIGRENQTFNTIAVAEQMAASVRLASAGGSAGMNPLMALALPDANSPERTAARKNLKDAAREITGESIGGQEAFNLELGLMQWMTGRTTLDIYTLRARRISKSLLQDWQSAQATFGAQQKQLTLVLLGIIFQDQLWEGADWKASNPQLALGRLKGLPLVAVEKWAAASKTTEFPFAAANSLVSVDSLFSGDSFQMQRFEEALPLARKLIVDPSPRK